MNKKGTREIRRAQGKNYKCSWTRCSQTPWWNCHHHRCLGCRRWCNSFSMAKSRPLEIPTKFATTGVKTDGTFLHNYPKKFSLVPLGHFNWKGNDARKDYFTYEKELLSGVLTIASQHRIVSHLPITWFCDHHALKTFLDSAPPR